MNRSTLFGSTCMRENQEKVANEVCCKCGGEKVQRRESFLEIAQSSVTNIV